MLSEGFERSEIITFSMFLAERARLRISSSELFWFHFGNQDSKWILKIWLFRRRPKAANKRNENELWFPFIPGFSFYVHFSACWAFRTKHHSLFPFSLPCHVFRSTVFSAVLSDFRVLFGWEQLHRCNTWLDCRQRRLKTSTIVFRFFKLNPNATTTHCLQARFVFQCLNRTDTKVSDFHEEWIPS